VALYLVGHVAFGARMLGAIGFEKLLAAAVALVVFVLGASLPAWGAVAAMAGVLVALCAVETARTFLP
jgi:hypothetical protein